MTKTKKFLFKLGRKCKKGFDSLFLIILMAEFILLNLLQVNTWIGVSIVVITSLVMLIFCVARAVAEHERPVIRKNRLLIIALSDYSVVTICLFIVFTILLNIFSTMEMYLSVLWMVFGGIFITNIASHISDYIEENKLEK